MHDIYSVELIPVKRRPRFENRHGKIHTYTPSSTIIEEQAVARSYTGQKYDPAIPLCVEINVFGRLPKGTPKTIIAQPFVIYPDIDNIAKAVLDGLNGVAYADDKQVVHLVVKKHARTREMHESIIYSVRPYEEEF